MTERIKIFLDRFILAELFVLAALVSLIISQGACNR